MGGIMINKKMFACLLSITLLLTTSTSALAYIADLDNTKIHLTAKVVTTEPVVYQVNKGDTLWKISQNYKIEVEEIKKLNGLSSNLLQIGQKLTLSHSTKENTVDASQQKYVVKKGDSLWVLAQRNKIHISDIMSKNNLQSDILQIGQILRIPTESSKATLANKGPTQKPLNKTALIPAAVDTSTFSYTEEEYEWLAKLIEAEAENQPYQGKVAVGSVVMNRIKDDWFPNTIKEVIFQKSNKLYQFSPVGNGRFDRVSPSDDSYQAATAALEGEDPTDGALYFYNPTIATDRWIRTRTVVKEIGQHSFTN